MSSLSRTSLFTVSGRVALVTGGGTGLGLMMAKGLTVNGAKVYISGRRKEVLDKAATEHGFIAVQMDVTDKKSIEAAVKIISEKEGKLDILINKQGFFTASGALGPALPWVFDDSDARGKTLGASIFNETEFNAWGDLFTLNITSVFMVTNAFLGLLEAGAISRGPKELSSVINISSTVSQMLSASGVYPYKMSKRAVEHLTEMLALLYSRKKIPVRVNSISPGPFPSEAVDAILAGKGVPLDDLVNSMNFWPGLTSPIPAQRAGSEEDLVGLTLYVASKAGDYSWGSNFKVDGGMSLANI